MNSINSHILQPDYTQDSNKFIGLPDKIKKILSTIDFSSIDEEHFHPNESYKIIKSIKRDYKNIIHSENDILKMEYLLDEIRDMVFGYFSNIFLVTDTFITVSKGKDRILSNIAFKDFTGHETNGLKTLYSKQELERINQAIDPMINGDTIGYQRTFTLNNQKIAWTTIRVFGTNINIRLGFPLYEGYDNEPFFRETDITNYEFNSNDFYFLNKINTHYQKRFEDIFYSMNGYKYEQDEFVKLFNQIKIQALILDYMLKFSRNPMAFYKGKEPIIFSETYHKYTGYSMKEIMDYFELNGEVITLFYKGEDLLDVIKALEKVSKDVSMIGHGYKDIPFTLTHKNQKVRMQIPWSNYLFKDSNLSDLSCRIGNIGKVKIFR